MGKILALILTLVLLVPTVVMADGICSFTYKEELVDADTESVYSSETHTACQVIIKAATEEFVFTEDGCDRCYCAEGLGTPNARVYEQFVERDCPTPCHDVSHVKWFEKEKPTAVQLNTLQAKPYFSVVVGGGLALLLAAAIF